MPIKNWYCLLCIEITSHRADNTNDLKSRCTTYLNLLSLRGIFNLLNPLTTVQSEDTPESLDDLIEFQEEINPECREAPNKTS